MGEPIPHVVSKSGASGSAPGGSIPIALYGGSATGPATGISVAGEPGIVGANVQEVLADLAARIVALESA